MLTKLLVPGGELPIPDGAIHFEARISAHFLEKQSLFRCFRMTKSGEEGERMALPEQGILSQYTRKGAVYQSVSE